MGKKLFAVAAIPAFNEERTIGKVVLLAQRYVDRVVVCDDGKEIEREIHALKYGSLRMHVKT